MTMLSDRLPSAICETVAPSVTRQLSEHCATHNSKRSWPLARQPLHAATSEQDKDAPFDAGPKALACLEVRALFS
jgi:hypothetical protein